MQLSKLFAYTVQPSRTDPKPPAPDGGEIPVDANLRSLIDNSIRTANFASGLSVAFVVDPTTRTNPTRDSVMSLAYAESGHVASSAFRLATSLSVSMDARSHPCLFIIAVLVDRNAQAVTLWAFPREDAFRFSSRRGTHVIEILTDVFSRTSRLRKAAFFRGRNLRNEFTTGTVMDFQAGKSTDAVANYWMSSFLLCTLAIASDIGTRLLARAIMKAYDGCPDMSDKEQLFAAMISVRRARRQRWSLADFAEHYLTGDALRQFSKAIPNTESFASSFDLNRPLFDELVHFRVFHLDTGVYVSSPPTQVGRSVRLSDDDSPVLTCTGTVVGDRLKVRHA